MRDIKKLIETYDKTAEHYAQSRLGHEPKEELTKFIEYVSARGRVLDVGCAAGRDTRILKDVGLDVIGIDLSAELLKIAKFQNPDIQFNLLDMRHTLFDDDSFDGIYANAVLHHLDWPEMSNVILEFKRIIKNNGLLYISTKKGVGILKTQEEMIKNEEREFTLLKEDELDQLLISNGFKKIELYSAKDKTRDLYWLFAFYRKK